MNSETRALLGMTLSHIDHLNRIGGLIKRLLANQPITTADLEAAAAADEQARRALDTAIDEARARERAANPPSSHRGA